MPIFMSVYSGIVQLSVVSGLGHALCEFVVSKKNNHFGMVGPESLRHISTYYFHVWIMLALLLDTLLVKSRNNDSTFTNLKSDPIAIFFPPASMHNLDKNNVLYIWIKLTPEPPQIVSA